MDRLIDRPSQPDPCLETDEVRQDEAELQEFLRGASLGLGTVIPANLDRCIAATVLVTTPQMQRVNARLAGWLPNSLRMRHGTTTGSLIELGTPEVEVIHTFVADALEQVDRIVAICIEGPDRSDARTLADSLRSLRTRLRERALALEIAESPGFEEEVAGLKRDIETGGPRPDALTPADYRERQAR